MTERFTIAIDGPAAAGKGTLSKAVATHFGFAHLDTGLLYRAVGAKMLLGVEPIVAARALTADDLDASDLRNPEVAQAASRVAVFPDVRDALLDFQRSFSRRAGGAVLDGRDIGTVICPNAEVKLFVTARADVRADRRYAELRASGDAISRATVLADVKERDARDRDRSEAPLTPAGDAIEIDTSDMSIKAAVAEAIKAVNIQRER